MMTWLIIFSILILLCISAFFSGSETALTAASRAKMHSLEQDGDHPRHSGQQIDFRARTIDWRHSNWQ